MTEAQDATLFGAPTWPGDAVVEMMALKAENRKAECLRVWAMTVGYLHTLCESPIEKALCSSLLAKTALNNGDSWFVLLDGRGYRWPMTPPAPAGAVCFLQARAGRYRPDFLFVVRRPTGEAEWFVVECDGHEHHERTKAQAARDRSRDRWMTANGIKVLRFTGAEIFKNSEACADEVMTFVFPDWK